jgi:hypothetical protein
MKLLLPSRRWIYTLLVCLIAAPAVFGSRVVEARAGAESPQARTCAPVSVYLGRSRTFTYRVVVARGSLSCSLARQSVRSFVLSNHAPRGTQCRLSIGSPWALSCARGSSVVRAYGPEPETKPWVIAAAKLDMPVFAPRMLAGFRLKSLVPVRHSCGPGWEQVDAQYTRADGATLEVAEGRPEFCANLGDPPLVARVRVQRLPAELFENCAPAGCAQRTGEYALRWIPQKVQMTLLTHAVTASQLLKIARSFALVPA